MTLMQEKAINEIKKMPDDQIAYIMQVIHDRYGSSQAKTSQKMKAYNEMLKLRETTSKYYDASFDPEKEIAEAIDEKYGSID